VFLYRCQNPKPSGGRRHAKLDPHRAFLISRIEEKADITMMPSGRRSGTSAISSSLQNAKTTSPPPDTDSAEHPPL
jgi:hypothetical protein